MVYWAFILFPFLKQNNHKAVSVPTGNGIYIFSVDISVFLLRNNNCSWPKQSFNASQNYADIWIMQSWIPPLFPWLAWLLSNKKAKVRKYFVFLDWIEITSETEGFLCGFCSTWSSPIKWTIQLSQSSALSFASTFAVIIMIFSFSMLLFIVPCHLFNPGYSYKCKWTLPAFKWCTASIESILWPLAINDLPSRDYHGVSLIVLAPYFCGTFSL